MRSFALALIALIFVTGCNFEPPTRSGNYQELYKPWEGVEQHDPDDMHILVLNEDGTVKRSPCTISPERYRQPSTIEAEVIHVDEGVATLKAWGDNEYIVNIGQPFFLQNDGSYSHIVRSDEDGNFSLYRLSAAKGWNDRDCPES